MLESIRGAGLTLEQVLSGECNGEISAALQAAGLDEDKWWRALLRVVQGEAWSTGFGLWTKCYGRNRFFGAKQFAGVGRCVITGRECRCQNEYITSGISIQARVLIAFIGCNAGLAVMGRQVATHLDIGGKEQLGMLGWSTQLALAGGDNQGEVGNET